MSKFVRLVSGGVLLWAVGVSLVVCRGDVVREWMDRDGRMLEALYLGQDDTTVQVRRVADGQEFRIPKARLSEQDQEWLAERQRHGETVSTQESMALVWPDRVGLAGELEVEILREDNREKVYIYRTKHFEFVSDAKLARKVVSEFAKVFEVALEGMKSQPLSWDPTPPEDGYRARLFASKEDYHAAGGPDGTGGVYLGSTKEILVPLSSLGVRGSSSGVKLDRKGGGHGTLMHEVTHQVMHEWLRYLPVWLTEGMAVYMEAVPMEKGELRFGRLDPEKYIRGGSGYRDEIPMINPERLMTMTHEDWQRNWVWNPLDVSRYYDSAFLLTYYFAHLDGEGDSKRLQAYLQAIKENGLSDDEKVQILLAGRSYQELASDIEKGYRKLRMKLKMF